MKISTSQYKSLMAADDAVVAPKTLCRAAGVNDDNIRKRLTYEGKKGCGQLTPDEEQALGDALASFLLEHLGLTLIDAGPLLELIDKQVAEDGIWFQAKFISEAGLQSELKKLHKAVEEGLGR